ncbi:MAG: thiamine-phosphate kinase [Lentisphaerae bacterium]|nr:thiamine-phosphate kinase [Lentisphaerota bacterium]
MSGPARDSVGRMETLRDIGELAAIERIARRLPGRRDVVVGVGDDCAVVRLSGGAGVDWVLTSDPVVQGTHFAAETAPEDVGHKAVGRVLSDIAAMGADPRWGLIDIVAPSALPVATLDGLYRGAVALAGAHDFCIVGGDLSEGPALEAHVFGVGAVPCGRAVLRSGARPGDLLFVTGTLGGSASGRHLRFEPRVKEGRWLRDWAGAMIDVSDGLAADARHLATMSGAGCDLDARAVPVSDAARALRDGVPPLDHALRDGEDFELLFALAEEREDEFMAAWRKAFDLPCTRIGIVTDRAGLVRCCFPDGATVALEGAGYAHFRQASSACAAKTTG